MVWYCFNQEIKEGKVRTFKNADEYLKYLDMMEMKFFVA